MRRRAGPSFREPSELSLLGLVRHLAEVKGRWFRRVLAGQHAPPLFTSDADPDADFDGAVPEPEVVATAWASWRAEVAFAEGLVAQAPDLDLTGKCRDPWRAGGRPGASLLVVHHHDRRAEHPRPARSQRDHANVVSWSEFDRGSHQATRVTPDSS